MAGKYESKIVDIAESAGARGLSSFAKDRVKAIGRQLDDKKITSEQAAEKISDECKLYLKGYQITDLAKKLDRLTW